MSNIKNKLGFILIRLAIVLVGVGIFLSCDYDTGDDCYEISDCVGRTGYTCDNADTCWRYEDLCKRSALCGD